MCGNKAALKFFHIKVISNSKGFKKTEFRYEMVCKLDNDYCVFLYLVEFLFSVPVEIRQKLLLNYFAMNLCDSTE